MELEMKAADGLSKQSGLAGKGEREERTLETL